jgi:hypothetical protein
MTEQTITYSQLVTGWTSFWSYIPDWMIGMNNSFYSWNNGDLYKHNTNEVRNNFYGSQSYSSISTILNQEPTTVKMFKTLELNSTTPWTTTITTDISLGQMDSSFYKNKEDQWFTYIRRPDDGTYDTRALSTCGIGVLSSYAPFSLALLFTFFIDSSISVGDKVYVISGGSLVLLGTIASHSPTIILLSALVGPAPSPGDMIVYVKNSSAESHGARGYYMQVDLTNGSTTQEEIFSISSVVFKSSMQ